MTSYKAILEDIFRRTEVAESPEVLREILKKHESTGIATTTATATATATDVSVDGNENESNTENEQQEILPFRPRGLTDLLVTRMMVVSPESKDKDEDNDNGDTTTAATATVTPTSSLLLSSTQAMKVARSLVECLPEVYLPSLATSVSDLVASVPLDTIVIGNETAPGLLRLWVSLIAYSSPLGVHELLSESLLALLARKQQHDAEQQQSATEALGYLLEDWRALHKSSKNNSSKVVRCAVVLVKWISRLPPKLGLELAQSSGATDLLVELLGDFDDPLQQLSLLDALIEEFDTTTASTTSTGRSASTGTTSRTITAAEEWLASPPLMSLVLQFLKDPLLSDAALRYIGVLVVVKPTETTLILDHVREVVSRNEGSIPTRETERLPLVNALVTLATSTTSSELTLDLVLNDSTLRRSWWDTDRIAQPKLKAAILVSIAQALTVVEKSFGSSKALQLYRLVGEDHQRSGGATTTTTTTLWLLSKNMANSPLVEVKIAAFAVLAACLRIQNGYAAVMVLGVADPSSHSALMDLLLSSRREPTIHAQSARYDLLTAFMDSLSAHPSLEEHPKTLQKLQEQLALGPHGQKTLQHGTDEMKTA